MGENPSISVLLVEDNAPTRARLAHLLGELGITCVQACDGEEAIAEIHARTFDLVILDMHLPQKDGFEVLAWLRASESKPKVVAAISAVDFHGTNAAQMALGLGADLAFSKPLTEDHIRQSVAQLGA